MKLVGMNTSIKSTDPAGSGVVVGFQGCDQKTHLKNIPKALTADTSVLYSR
jgi:hypothetical protein